jgi:hypothetical protein
MKLAKSPRDANRRNIYFYARRMPPLKSFCYIIKYNTNQLIALKSGSPNMTLDMYKHTENKI